MKEEDLRKMAYNSCIFSMIIEENFHKLRKDIVIKMQEVHTEYQKDKIRKENPHSVLSLKQKRCIKSYKKKKKRHKSHIKKKSK